jgi:hypothetical protein
VIGRPIGARLLDELHQALTRYVVLPSPEAVDAVVLWITATHAAPAWNCAPRLDITSPVKRCGKSRLLDIIEATCYHPLLTVNISPAALVRSIGDDPPTLLLDEADTVFGPKAGDAHEDLRGILNAGHSRGRPYIRSADVYSSPRQTVLVAVLRSCTDHPLLGRGVTDVAKCFPNLRGWLRRRSTSSVSSVACLSCVRSDSSPVA